MRKFLFLLPLVGLVALAVAAPLFSGKSVTTGTTHSITNISSRAWTPASITVAYPSGVSGTFYINSGTNTLVAHAYTSVTNLFFTRAEFAGLWIAPREVLTISDANSCTVKLLHESTMRD